MATGSKDNGPEETFRLDQNDPIDMPESHFGNRPRGRQKGGSVKLQSPTKCAENVRAADRARPGQVDHTW